MLKVLFDVEMREDKEDQILLCVCVCVHTSMRMCVILTSLARVSAVGRGGGSGLSLRLQARGDWAGALSPGEGSSPGHLQSDFWVKESTSMALWSHTQKYRSSFN
jgi:hypothetical protein